MGRSCSHNEEDRSPFKISTGKPSGKRPSGRIKRRWEDTIGMDAKEISFNARNLVDSALVRDY